MCRHDPITIRWHPRPISPRANIFQSQYGQCIKIFIHFLQRAFQPSRSPSRAETRIMSNRKQTEEKRKYLNRIKQQWFEPHFTDVYRTILNLRRTENNLRISYKLILIFVNNVIIYRHSKSRKFVVKYWYISFSVIC